jgi:uncharacterized membrane protein YraQ (UPF0718 family)
MLSEISDWLTYSLLGFDSSSAAGHAVNFFIYDSAKIILLLFLLVFAMGFLRTYIPRSKVRKWLTARRGAGNLFASLFGAVTPFCSCSSIPVFLGFMEAGVPLGPAFSFLITSPLVNEYLVILMLGFFGIKITVAYILCGIIIGTVAGLALGRMNLERHLVRGLVSEAKAPAEASYSSLRERLLFGKDEAFSIVKKIWLWIVAGVGIGALIHNYVPQETIQALVSSGGIFSVPLATLLGVPVYGNCVAIVPIAVVLFQKGVPLGTALSFMMATAALSLPEAVILRRAMNLKLILIFFAIVASAIIATGYLFNLLETVLI